MNIEYCCLVDKQLPMLHEEEWQKLSPLFANTSKKIKTYRAQYSYDIDTVRASSSPEIVEMFEELTGFKVSATTFCSI